MRLVSTFLVIASLSSGCSMLAPGGGGRDVAYEIKAGDTLSKLADIYGVPAEEIQAYNAIRDPKKLRVGQRLIIPAVGPLKSSTALPLPEARPIETEPAQLKMVSIAGVRSYIGDLEYPVQSSRYSSRFGWRWSKFHEGIDLAAPEGADVLAAHDGEVVFVSESWSGYGKVIIIKGDRFMTVYGHNSRNKVSKGDRVEKGNVIAKVGQTGDASGPHLHFETRVLNHQGRFAAVNPMVFYP
jgi:murein DD-endopeptidase MepM/ murein hydrolase activator NlpD